MATHARRLKHTDRIDDVVVVVSVLFFGRPFNDELMYLLKDQLPHTVPHFQSWKNKKKQTLIGEEQ